jgi:3-oxoacyl-[acyl-carrier-protein] synthase-3
VQLSDLKLVLMHQANLRINSYVQKTLGLPDEKGLQQHPELRQPPRAATIPLLWDECVREGRIQPGDLVLMVAIARALHWGATLLRA